MTRTEAEAALFKAVAKGIALTATLEPALQTSHIANDPAKPAKPPRRRVDATYCPLCSSWVEVRLRPVRLRCTGCGVEARL